ncbi:hypothetical protein F5Y08DRAFT_313892 [Xylaria arbuscula]|nr:hypothetical protein F5Y08DRAFT_313892 [Xylaria arbuscula]
MRCAKFAVLVGLVTGLHGHVIDRQIKPTSTVTVTADAHPLTFWALAHLAPDATPLPYGDPPTASRVPPIAPPNPTEKVNAVSSSSSSSPSCSEEHQTSIGTIPSPITTTTTPTPTTTPPSATSRTSTTKCTVFRAGNPTSTLPAFCRPTLFANAPLLSNPANPAIAQATATVTMGANSVPDKVSCCAYCAAYYNCYAWRFVPSYVGTPSEALPGGFDPWRHGGCEIAFYTGDGSISNDTSDDTREGGEGGEVDVEVTRKGAADICPNGRLKGVLDGSGNPGTGTDIGMGMGIEVESDPWFIGLYYNGWNQGACADLGGVIYTPGRDLGVGDGSRVCVV